MPRQLKPQQVGEYEHRAHGKFPLYLDRNTLEFTAEVAQEPLRYPSIEALRNAVHEAVSKLDDLDWKPIIHLRSGEDAFWGGRHRNRVSFEFTRFYLAKAPDGTHRECHWDLGTKFDGSAYSRTEVCKVWRGWDSRAPEFNPPCNPVQNHFRGIAPDTCQIFLPYTDATWAALEALDAMLLTLKGRIADLLFVPENAALLAERLSGVKLLGM